MKKLLFLLFISALLIPGVIAESNPQIVKCGISPVTIHPGENFTIYADVLDPDGFHDIHTVGLLYQNQFLLALPEGNRPGHFEVSYTMPQDATHGTFQLAVAAVDQSFQASSLVNFAFSIAGKNADTVNLLSPEEAYTVDCTADTVFSWTPPAGVDFDAYAFAFYMDGQELIVPMPDSVTEFAVPGMLWQMIPDGTYYWKVGLFTDMASEPSFWSELRSFNVHCNNEWPTVEGTVVDIDASARILYLSNDPAATDRTPVQITDTTEIFGNMGPINFDDIQIGMYAAALGEWTGDVFTATQLFVDDGHGPGPGDYVEGEIVNIDAAAKILYLAGSYQNSGDLIAVQVTDDTQIFDRMGPMAFEDIQVGMFAAAQGEWTGDTFTAVQLFVDDGHGPGPGDYVEGEIVNIDPDAKILYLAGSNPGSADQIIVQITDYTEITGNMGPMAFEDIQVGMYAAAQGEWNGDTFTAVLLFVDDDPGPGPGDSVVGEIVEIDAAAKILYLSGGYQNSGDRIPVQVTDDTDIFGNSGPMTFEDIEIGMFAAAEGEWTGDIFTAVQLFVDDGHGPGPGDFVEGEVVEIDAAAKILYLRAPYQQGTGDRIPVQVMDQTLIFGNSGPITFEDIQVGMYAAAQGGWDNDMFIAVELFIDDGQGPGESVGGEIVEIDAAAKILYLSGGYQNSGDRIPVQVTDDTRIFGNMGPIAFEDIQVGMYASAHGEWDGDLFTAVELFVDEGQGPNDQVEGEIVNIDPAAKILYIAPLYQDPVPVQVTDETQISGHMGPMPFEDIQVGMYAAAQGEWTGDIFTAEQLFVDDGQGPGPGDYVQGEIVNIDTAAKLLYLAPAYQQFSGNEIAVQVTDDTQIYGNIGSMAFEDIQVGMYCAALGEWNAALFTAAQLFVCDGYGPGPGDQVVGEITYIDPNAMQFTVANMRGNGQDVIVQVTNNTQIRNDDGNPLVFSDLAEGDFTINTGSFQGDLFMADEVIVSTR